jgi:pimeloyl-ACP methyl ester carboxylesterase
MPLVTLGGVGIMVEEAGDGDALVLVHGSWADRGTWVLVEEDLVRSWRVVSYDRRGHAASEDGPGPGSRREDENDLAALIDALGAAPAHLAANSFGASIALGLASRRPELVRSVCAHEPPLVALAAGHPAVERFHDDVDEILPLISRGEDEAAARLFVERVVGPGSWDALSARERRAIAAHARTFAGEVRDPAWATTDLDALAAIPCPVLLTRGGASPPMFAPVIDRLAAAMDRAEVRMIPGAGHVPHLTHPSEWTAAVRDVAGRTA